MRVRSETVVKRFRIWVAAVLLAVLGTSVASAQFSNSYNFLKAVRERDGQKATDLLNQPGSTIVNTRDITSGETALHIVVERRDATWIGFLLQRGADPNIRRKDGMTPLLLATNLRYVDGAEILLGKKARVDETNNSGETPLIRAVQLRDLAMVRLLLKNGANPDIPDTIAGRSARDYASDDPRAAPILEAIQNAGKDDEPITPKVFGPTQ